MADQGAAQARINQFAAQSGDSRYFPNIARVDVAAGLRQRLADPTRIDSISVNLCGPAAYFYCLVQDKPDVYVKYVTQLYNDGYANLGTLKIEPSAGCRNYRPDPAKIAPVDWVALASLRDSENLALSFSSIDDRASGMTLPSGLAGWFDAVDYHLVRNNTNLVITKGRSEIDEIRWRRGTSWICLLVHDNMLQPLLNTHRSWTANHWVVLEPVPMSITSDRISLKVYSWGGIRNIDLSFDDFCRNFYGYVSASTSRF